MVEPGAPITPMRSWSVSWVALRCPTSTEPMLLVSCPASTTMFTSMLEIASSPAAYSSLPASAPSAPPVLLPVPK